MNGIAKQYKSMFKNRPKIWLFSHHYLVATGAHTHMRIPILCLKVNENRFVSNCFMLMIQHYYVNVIVIDVLLATAIK